MPGKIRTGNGKTPGSANLSKLLQSVLHENKGLEDSPSGTGSESSGFMNSGLSGADRLEHGNSSGMDSCVNVKLYITMWFDHKRLIHQPVYTY